jgi:UDP-N-acetylglucosamine 2-epimerase (non-hydrolysing)/UDP-GlcNAc3NAcA epimerase
MKILTVVGNRPQFVKAAAVSGLLREEHEERLVHTGQHYDDALSKVFFSELGLAKPDRELGIGGGSNTSQTARMLSALEGLLEEERPHAVLVYGDTNSTLAGALAAAQAHIPVVHVEAGMRSFDRAMPEELNRVLTDHLSELLLCSSQSAAENLARESVAGHSVVVGDVMVDVALRWQPRAREQVEQVAPQHGVRPGEYVLATAHRAGNVDDPARLAMLVALLQAVGEWAPVVFPVHPRTRERLTAAGLWTRLEETAGMHLSGPAGYTEFTALLCGARAVATDSGGVQKEAYLAGVPCATLRENTEWVETVQSGWNTLVDLDARAAVTALSQEPPAERPQLYGDGHAAERCVAAIGRMSV